MKRFLPALVSVVAVSLAGCAPTVTPYRGELVPPYVPRPMPSMRMAMMQCAIYDPFRADYIDRIGTMTEPELSKHARATSADYAACMHELGWNLRMGAF